MQILALIPGGKKQAPASRARSLQMSGDCFGAIAKINGEIVSPCLLGHFQQATELP